MSLTVSESKGFELIEEDTYTAICYGVIDLGIHHDKTFKKDQNKVLFMWELPDVTYEGADGKEARKVLSKQYTLSLHERSSMRQDLESWRGRAFSTDELAGFNVSKLLGVPCLLQVVHDEYNGKKYAKVGAIMRLPKGMEVPSLENEQIVYDFDNPDRNVLEKLPEWIQTKIKEAKNYVPDVSDSLKPVESGDLPF